MPDSYTTELRDLIDRAFTAEHSGRATAQMVHNSVHRDLPEHLVDFLVGKGLRSQIGAYFRDQDPEGLPKRPEVNADGEHAQLELMSISEFGYAYGKYLDRAEANQSQAEKLRQKCLTIHGTDIGSRAVA